VYAVLPLTRRLVAAADRRLLNYALGIWFVLGCLAPTLKFFPPLSLVGGIPAQYPINLTWCAVGYGVLGDVLTQEAPRHRPRTFVWLYLAGTALTFGLTLAASVKTGALYQVFLQGSAPGVCLQAAGLYGFCAARWQNRDRWPVAETVSKASFCIYLTHLFFLDFLAGRGLSAGTLPPVWGVPVLAAAAFGGGFLVWLVLRRVPVVKTYLI
jgi:surface polysaccharide O-acyltransferase-like enzyme